MEHNPLFSVLVSNYNNGRFISECIQSVFSQTYSNWELVIVDDGSNDHSLSEIEKFTSDPRVRLFENSKNMGVAFSKNKCVNHSSGELAGFLDSDDALDSEALRIMVDGHKNHPRASLVYSTHYICDEGMRPIMIADYVGQIPENKKAWESRERYISNFSSFKVSNYFLTGGISVNVSSAEDKDLYYKLEETGPVVFIDKPLYYYRHHSSNISLNKNRHRAYRKHLGVKAMVVFRSANRADTIARMPHKRSELAGGALYLGGGSMKQGYQAMGLKLFFQAFRVFHVYCVWAIFKYLYRLVSPSREKE
jgi:glycosyltransferase involved in cell wall biosynthesis